MISEAHLRELIGIELLKMILFSVIPAHPDKLCWFPTDRINATLNLCADDRLKMAFNDQMPSGTLASGHLDAYGTGTLLALLLLT